MKRAPSYFEHLETMHGITSFELIEPDAELLCESSIEVEERELTPAQFARLVRQTYGGTRPNLTLVRKTSCTTR